MLYKDFLLKYYSYDVGGEAMLINRCLAINEDITSSLRFFPLNSALVGGSTVTSIISRKSVFDFLEVFISDEERTFSYMHRFILTIYIGSSCFSKKRAINLRDITNMSSSIILDFEKRRLKSCKLFIELFECSIRSIRETNTYIYVCSLIANEFRLRQGVGLLLHDAREGNTIIRNGRITTIISLGLSYSIKLTVENILMHGLEHTTPGWNLIFLADVSFEHRYSRNVLLHPLNITIKEADTIIDNLWKLYDNATYTAPVWIPNDDYETPFSEKDCNHVPNGILEYLNVLEKLNLQTFIVNPKIYELINSICSSSTPPNSPHLLYIWGKNIEHRQRHLDVCRDLYSSYINKNVFYFNFLYDRRTRMYPSQYPVNYQQVPICRHILADPTPLTKIYYEIYSYLNKLSVMEREAISYNELTCTITDCIKDINKIPLPLYYIIAVYEHLILRLLSFKIKITPRLSNTTLFKLHEQLILSWFTCSSTPELAIINFNFNVPDDEFLVFYTAWEAFQSLKINSPANVLAYIDASGSVFQMHALITACPDPRLLHMTGLVPDLSMENDGIYSYILDYTTRNDTNNQYVKYLSRDLIKRLAMPRMYGLTRLGLNRTLRELFGSPETDTEKNFRRNMCNFLWDNINSSLLELGFDIDTPIKIYGLLYDNNVAVSFDSPTGAPINLNKIKKTSDKRKRDKHSVMRYFNGNFVRITIKKDLHPFTYTKNHGETKNGLYVGLVHNNDAYIEQLCIQRWSMSSPLCCIHDSNGSNFLLLPILSLEYKRSLIENARRLHNNHPIVKIIDDFATPNEIKNTAIVSQYRNDIVKNIAYWKNNNIYDKLLFSKRIIY